MRVPAVVASAAPQLLQKLAPTGLSRPQLAQVSMRSGYEIGRQSESSGRAPARLGRCPARARAYDAASRHTLPRVPPRPASRSSCGRRDRHSNRERERSGNRERAEAQRRACDRASRLAKFPVVLALMNPEAEAWEIAAFQPLSDDGRERHAPITPSLTFDPVRQPERMTSTSGLPERDCKAVHRALLDDERPCHQRPLTELLATAASTGLPAYLGDVHAAFRAAFKLPDLPES